MDFTFSAEQEEIRHRTLTFAHERLAGCPDEGSEGRFDRTAWSVCGQQGIQGLPIPREFGGAGVDPLATVLALEALGYACRDQGLLFALNAHMWGCEIPIATFGSDDQKRRWLPGLCDGSRIGALAAAEPESGSDAYSLSTTAEPARGRYLLNGTKMFVTNAPLADLILVLARLPRTKGSDGLAAFVVERDTPGLSVRTLDKMGLRSAQMGEVKLDGCEVPADVRLGGEGQGVSVFTEAMTWERSFILASAVGAMQHQFEQAVSHAKRRKQFGQPIGKFQHVSGRLVDMRLRIQCARLLLYNLAWLKGQDRSVLQEAAMTKLFISEAWVASSLDALRIRGGYGYLTETRVERDVRDALGSTLFSGTSDIQRVIISRFLGF